MNRPPLHRDQNIVAIGLLTAEELRNVGRGLHRVYSIPDDGAFDDLIRAVDAKARQARRG